EKAIPYKYDATMLQDGKEIPNPPLSSVVSIADGNKLLRSGRILPAFEKLTDIVKKMPVPDPGKGKEASQS
ncbi:anthranilate synthase alpha, partial [Trifolium medium]|nr:anthranilate synthase alpha [Trifolium medium]